MIKIILFSSLLFVTTSTFASVKIISVQDLKNAYRAADVYKVEHVKSQATDVKLFIATGGDPAMNGSHLCLAIFNQELSDWQVFELADILDYKLLPSAKKGFLKIKLTKDVMDNEANITQKESTMFINLTGFFKGSVQVEEIEKK